MKMISNMVFSVFFAATLCGMETNIHKNTFEKTNDITFNLPVKFLPFLNSEVAENLALLLQSLDALNNLGSEKSAGDAEMSFFDINEWFKAYLPQNFIFPPSDMTVGVILNQKRITISKNIEKKLDVTNFLATIINVEANGNKDVFKSIAAAKQINEAYDFMRAYSFIYFHKEYGPDSENMGTLIDLLPPTKTQQRKSCVNLSANVVNEFFAERTDEQKTKKNIDEMAVEIAIQMRNASVLTEYLERIEEYCNKPKSSLPTKNRNRSSSNKDKQYFIHKLLF